MESDFPKASDWSGSSDGRFEANFAAEKKEVDDWWRPKTLQHQEKKLSVTRVLLDSADGIAGFYTLASGQVNFSDLPLELAKHLPKRELPVAVLAWLGVKLGLSR